MTTYNQSGYVYNQAGAIYDQFAIERTATGTGTGASSATRFLIAKRTGISIAESDSTAATFASRNRLRYLVDYHTGFYGNGGRFYLGAPIRQAEATGAGTGTQTANPLHISVRTATGTGTGTSNNAIVLGRLRTGYGSGGATAGDTATILITHVRSATGSGTGASSVTYLEKLLRTATASGVGSSSIVVLHVAPRTATGGGTGSSSATRILVSLRTGTGSGTGTQTSVGARAVRRTSTGSGSGSGTADWVKSHIFRVPYTETYPSGYFGGGDAANRLRRYDRSNIRTLNLYKLNDGTYTTIEQRDLGQVVKLWHGGRDHFLTEAEIVELTAAGFGASIT